MKTTRQTLLAFLLTAMMIGTLAMPASAAAATRSSVAYTTDYSNPFDALLQFLSNLWSWFDRDERVLEQSFWVRPGVDATISVGQATLYIPRAATREMDTGFRLTMAVQRVRNGVIVDLEPDGVTFSGRGVLLSFGRDVASAVDESGNPLQLAPRGRWLGNDPAFWIEHFSRYSGWF